MRTYLNHVGISFVSLFLFSLVSCSNIENSNAQSLTAKLFQEQIHATSNAQLIDVRTPGEFQGGFIENAVNIDWNSSNFSKETSKLDKQIPIFVYCLSGGRSAAAASSLRKAGFKKVVELEGGIMAWQSAGLPLSNQSERKTGMSQVDFQKMLDTKEKVLVDFYAEWCAPCKKMKPYLEEIEKNKKGIVKVIRIDIEANPILTKELKVESIPVLHLYDNKQLIWQNTGYIEKEAVLNVLNDK